MTVWNEMWQATGGAVELTSVRLGLVPLTDCAPLALAFEQGRFRQYGIEVELRREPSWANIRDKVVYGALDGAHMLHALPLAIALGLGCRATPMSVPLVLNLNGNAITLSRTLVEQMDGARDPAALRRVIERRRAIGAPPLTFGATFPWSSHNYLLRYWLAAGGIDPDRDLVIAIVPPPLMAQNLAARRLDGFCVGEPWGQLAMDRGDGVIAAMSRDIRNSHPEKVLAFTAEFAQHHPRTVRALMAAVLEAARWLDEPANRVEAARILVERGYVEAPVASVLAGLADTQDRILFHRGAANFPWLSHAQLSLVQMRRWGQIGPEVDIAQAAAAVYRPDLYRPVATALGIPCPLADSKIEGTHDGPWLLQEATQPIAMAADRAIDGRRFDPADIAGHLAGLSTSSPAAAPQRAAS